jgi:hypothetical protein
MACLGLVEKALTVKKMPQWEGKVITANSRFRKGGEGATELERLLFILGWGDTKKNYGWISDAIPMKEIKAEFRRLAQKYDSEGAAANAGTTSANTTTGNASGARPRRNYRR